MMWRTHAVFSVCLLAGLSSAAAEWIAAAAQKDTRVACFRQTIANVSAVTSGTLEITAGGTFYAYLNGRRIGEDFLAPGFTCSGKRRIVMTYDLTPHLKTAAGATNELAVEVSPSWFEDAITRGNGNFGRGDPSLMATVTLVGADGSVRTVPTDGTWCAAFAGDVIDCGIYEGERADGRLATDWRTAKVGWPKAVAIRRPNVVLAKEEGSVPRIRPDLTLQPVRATVFDGVDGVDGDRYGKARAVRTYRADEPMALRRGERLVVDFGQNHVGVPSFSVDGPRGARLLVRFGEMLNDGCGRFDRGNDGPEGIPYFANLRKAAARAEYTLAGGTSAYEPRFTFFGYRYALFEATDDVVLSDLVAKVVTSVRERTGTIETGDARVNRLIRNCEWGHYANHLSVPTDCPQRDERIGWTGDTQVFSLTAAYCADVYGFFSKWMRDVVDIQHADGGYTEVAPPGAWGPWDMTGGATGWGDAGVIVPYNMYLMYGRESVVRENWESLIRYAGFLEKHRGPVDKFGDWLVIGRENDTDLKRVLSASFWVWDLRMLKAMAKGIGRTDDVLRFERDEAEAVRNYCENYLDETGLLKPQYRCQTAYAYAAKLGLISADKSAAALRGELARFDNHLSTGFLGTAVLLDALTDVGLDELAVTVLLQPTYPGWLYSVDQGATTMWERWNSYTKEKGFGPAGMNSFNHYAYGAVLGWMYSRLAGIRPCEEAPGFRRIVLAPHPDRRLGHCKAVYDSAAGRIESAWECDAAGNVRYRFVVPQGATAVLRLPGRLEEDLPAGSHERNGRH